MIASNHDATSNEINLRLWWGGVTALLAVVIFTEAVFAGAMLSGIAWARGAHAANALVAIIWASAAGLAGLVTLRRTRHGLKLAISLLSLAVVMALQIAIGVLSAKGANLLWIHIPLGVALVAQALYAVAGARKLGAA